MASQRAAACLLCSAHAAAAARRGGLTAAAAASTGGEGTPIGAPRRAARPARGQTGRAATTPAQGSPDSGSTAFFGPARQGVCWSPGRGGSGVAVAATRACRRVSWWASPANPRARLVTAPPTAALGPRHEQRPRLSPDQRLARCRRGRPRTSAGCGCAWRTGRRGHRRALWLGVVGATSGVRPHCAVCADPYPRRPSHSACVSWPVEGVVVVGTVARWATRPPSTGTGAQHIPRVGDLSHRSATGLASWWPGAALTLLVTLAVLPSFRRRPLGSPLLSQVVHVPPP